MGWLNSHAIGLCVSTTTTVKTKAAPVEIEAPRQVLDHNLIFWLYVRVRVGRLLGPDPDRGPPVSDLWFKAGVSNSTYLGAAGGGV